MPTALKRKKRELKLEPQCRSYQLDPSAVDEVARTVEVAFSSEEEIQRWWGNEILDHDDGSVRLGRLNDGGAVLVEHDRRDHIGVVEKAWIGEDRVARAIVRFGKSARAEEVFQDVKDGVKPHISTWYTIHRAILEEERDDGPDTYRIMDWEPNEISFVAIPFDTTVGVGRSAETAETKVTIEYRNQEMDPDEVIKDPEPGDGGEKRSKEPKPVNVRAVEDKARDGERNRVADILALGEQHDSNQLARSFVKEGKSVDEFKTKLLESRGKPVESDAADLGLTEKEKGQFSIVRGLRALADPSNPRLREEAAFEFEVSDAASKKRGKEAQGIHVPFEVLAHERRDLNVGTATAGGHTVSTDLLASSFIDLLRNYSALLPMSTVLTGLVGDVAIPRLTGAATAYWVGEGSAPTESQETFGQLAMSPKTVAGTVDLTRKLLLQSSNVGEPLVRRDLATVLSLALDLAGINGSGTGSEPEGILNTSGIGSVALGTNGGAPAWEDLVKLEEEVAVDNALMGNLRYLSNAKFRSKLKRTSINATYGDKMILDGNDVNGYEFVTSNQVPSTLTKGTGSNLSAAIFGNFADWVIGLWSGVDIIVDPYSQSRSGTVQVTAFQDADMGPRHEESFAAIVDAITT
ncbi:MAG: phage major capsid protein [Planctomycetes bacterium]|nr:phage major capsid protein [Planctomycetota bacterium]